MIAHECWLLWRLHLTHGSSKESMTRSFYSTYSRSFQYDFFKKFRAYIINGWMKNDGMKRKTLIILRSKLQRILLPAFFQFLVLLINPIQVFKRYSFVSNSKPDEHSHVEEHQASEECKLVGLRVEEFRADNDGNWKISAGLGKINSWSLATDLKDFQQQPSTSSILATPISCSPALACKRTEDQLSSTWPKGENV